MKTITILYSTVLLVVFSTSSFAQTKLIHHKSHSGSLSTFKIAYEKNLFDIGESNFGDYPTFIVKNSQLDSLIFLTDSTTVMVTSEYCHDRIHPKHPPKQYQRGSEYQERDTDTSSLWHPGRAILQNHPDFNRKKSEEDIRKVLEKNYNFQNNPMSVVIIDSTKDEENEPNNNVQHEIKKTEPQENIKPKPKNNSFKTAWITIAIVVITTLSTGIFTR